MGFTVNAACGCFIGMGRGNNEDNFYFNKKHLPADNGGLKNPLTCRVTTDEPVVFAVFDGMGGECRGEEAACRASEVFSQEAKKLDELVLSGKEFLLEACEKANSAVNALREEKLLSSMGSTVAAIYFAQGEVVGCNLGDSKIFRIRDGKMMQISEDHTDEKILAAMGIQKKPVLLQYLGVPDKQMALEPYITKGDLHSGDIYILCSDGITDVIPAEAMFETVCKYAAEDAVTRLLADVAEHNGADNATVIVAKIA